jgi:hypothetical protein
MASVVGRRVCPCLLCVVGPGATGAVCALGRLSGDSGQPFDCERRCGRARWVAQCGAEDGWVACGDQARAGGISLQLGWECTYG